MVAATRKMAEILKFRRKEKGKKEKREQKGKREGEKGFGIEWGSIWRKTKELC